MSRDTIIQWTVIIYGFSVNIAVADLGVMDPTRPVYEQPFKADAAQTSEDAQEQVLASTIPALSQLLYSKSRKIAIFDELIVRIGDQTDFGRIADIRADRVLVEVNDRVQEVFFVLDQEEAKPEETAD